MQEYKDNLCVRGACFLADLSGLGEGIQRGYRPVVVVTSERGLASSEVIQIVPLTTKDRLLSVNPKVEASFLNERSFALCNQIRPIPKALLRTKLGVLQKKYMKRIDRAILEALGIEGDVNESNC